MDRVPQRSGQLYTINSARRFSRTVHIWPRVRLACRAVSIYAATLRDDEADEASMVGLAKTHLKRSVVGINSPSSARGVPVAQNINHTKWLVQVRTVQRRTGTRRHRSALPRKSERCARHPPKSSDFFVATSRLRREAMLSGDLYSICFPS